MSTTVNSIFGYDSLGRRIENYVQLDSTFDFYNEYQYDNLSRLKWVKQYGISGLGNAVASKRADFIYNAVGQFSIISRYAATGTSQLVAQSSYGYDGVGRISNLYHGKSSTDFADYGLTWDSAGRLLSFTNTVRPSEDVTYTYDASGQLRSVYDSSSEVESYTYDENGNRVGVDNNAGSATYTTGDNNLLEDDGTFTYEYDGEGNRVKRIAADGSYVAYEWDHRNRLVSVSTYDEFDDLQKKVFYLYDAFDRLIGKRINVDGDSDIDATEAYIYDGDQIVLQFGDDNDAALDASDLTHRYLWGPAVDQLLADEKVTSLSSAGTVSWALGDHQNTVRDVVQYNSSTNTTTVVNHNSYDSFGNKLSQTSPSNDLVFGYTGKIYDVDTGLQWNGSQQGGGRWYDANVGRWLGEDFDKFGPGDPNLQRYVLNRPTCLVDPTGRPPGDPQAFQAWLAALPPVYWTNPNTGKRFLVPRTGMGVFKAPSYGPGGPPNLYKYYFNNPSQMGSGFHAAWIIAWGIAGAASGGAAGIAIGGAAATAAGSSALGHFTGGIVGYGVGGLVASPGGKVSSMIGSFGGGLIGGFYGGGPKPPVELPTPLRPNPPAPPNIPNLAA